MDGILLLYNLQKSSTHNLDANYKINIQHNMNVNPIKLALMFNTEIS